MANDVPARQIQMFSNYDKAFVNKCRTVKLFTQDRTKNDVAYPIPCVFATPDRAFAQIRSQIARKKGIAEDTIKTIPLPIASISRVDQKIDLKRYVRYKFGRLFWVPARRKYIGMLWPAPWDMVYQLDLWTRNISELDDLTSQVVLWLRANEFYLTVDHQLPMGERIVLTELVGMTERSNTNPDTEEKRTLRRTFTFVVHGWIVQQPVDATIIEKVVVDFYDSTNELAPEFLERVVVTEPSEDEPSEPKMGNVTTTYYLCLIVGNAEAGKTYGSFQVPARSVLTGLQAAVLGIVPTGDDLTFQLVVNGVPDVSRYISVAAGDAQKAIVFGTPRTVETGDVLSVKCTNIGSIQPGSWIELRCDAQVEVFA